MSEEAKMSLIKVDRKGRMQYGAEPRREALAAFEKSGQTAMDFAEHLGVKYSTFASWVSKAKRPGEGKMSKKAAEEPKSLLAEVRDEADSVGVSVSLPGGVMARAGNREEILARDLRVQDWVQVDETPIDRLAPGHGSTRPGYLWTYAHPEVGVLYDWHGGRAHECLDNILGKVEGHNRFRGVLLSDGYKAYETWEDVTLATCWAHVRRKFYEASEYHPRQAAPILQLIGELFGIEQKLRNSRAGPVEVRRHRRKHSAPILKKIQDHLQNLSFLPKSTLGRARSYTFELWSQLIAFLEHGEIPLDHNRVENAIRPTKLGAKNWLFIGGVHTGQRSAILYTMVENIRTQGGDPFAYLKDVLTRIPAMTNQQNLRPLLPRNWLAQQRRRSSAA